LSPFKVSVREMRFVAEPSLHVPDGVDLEARLGALLCAPPHVHSMDCIAISRVINTNNNHCHSHAGNCRNARGPMRARGSLEGYEVTRQVVRALHVGKVDVARPPKRRHRGVACELSSSRRRDANVLAASSTPPQAFAGSLGRAGLSCDVVSSV